VFTGLLCVFLSCLVSLIFAVCAFRRISLGGRFTGRLFGAHECPRCFRVQSAVAGIVDACASLSFSPVSCTLCAALCPQGACLRGSMVHVDAVYMCSCQARHVQNRLCTE